MATYQHREMNQFQHDDLDKMEDIDIFDDEGDILLDLDWQQYTLGRRYVMCGVDWSCLVRALPCLPILPPEWWYRISKKQRKWFKGGVVCLGVLLLLALILTIALIPWGGKSVDAYKNDNSGADNIESIKPIAPQTGCDWMGKDPTSLLRPIAYRLDIDASFVDPYVSNGYVEMDFELVEESACVAVHKGEEVTIKEAVLLGSGEKGLHSHNETSGVSKIEFPTTISGGKATIAFKFDVVPAASFAGFKFKDVNGEIGGEQKILTSFSGGRHIFPCIDEVNVKATFTANMTVPAGLTTISNMPVVSKEEISSEDRVKFVFDRSPPMIAHVLTFVAAKMSSVGKETQLREKKASIGIYGRNRVDEMKPTLDRAATDLSTYETFLDMPFPLPKIDYFTERLEPHGGENWGLILMGESGLSQHPNLTDAFRLRRANELVAHETSHLWFAEVVGLDAEKDFFLQESMATYMQYLAGEVSMPNVGGFDRFYVENLLPALAADDGLESPPLTTRVGEPGPEIRWLIQYNKGASLMRMLRTYFLKGNDSPPIVAKAKPDEDPIRDGLQRYMKKFKFGNAGVADFWNTLGEATGEPLNKLMDRWTYQPGAPIIHVLLEGNQVVVKQSPLSLNPCEEGSEWWIPIGFKTKVNPEPQWKVLDTCGPMNLTQLASEEDSVLVNHEGFGYFRTHYHWDVFGSWFPRDSVEDIVNPTMSSTDFAVLLSDTFAMNEAGKYKIEVFMNLTSYLGSRLDVSWSPWQVALDNLGKIRNLMQSADTGCAEEFSDYVRKKLTDPILEKISDFEVGEDDSMDLRLMRSAVLLAAADFGDKKRLETAQELFDGDDFIHADLRDMVYRMAVSHGDSSVFDEIFTRGKQETQVHEKHRLLGALLYTTNSTQRRELWDFSSATHQLSNRDIAELVEHSRGTPTNDLFDIGVETLGSHGYVTQKLIYQTALFVTAPDRVTRLQDVASKRPSLTHLAANVARTVQKNQQWLETNSQKVCDWLKGE
ncbi:hypothetical protein BSKO_07039 [Bryopsis sp. KO-2023]|nr:hypothetical protein BSKO_07039 [Bryopsis sp. KO-2023]